MQAPWRQGPSGSEHQNSQTMEGHSKSPASDTVRSVEEFYELSDIDNADLSSLNGRTLQSARVDAGGVFYDDEDDEDAMDMKEKRPLTGLLSFFLSGFGATFLLLMCFALIFGAVGATGYFLKMQTPIVFEVINLWTLLLLMAAIIFSLAVVRLTINLALRGFGLVLPWNWIHYAKELEPHISSLVWLLGWLVAVNYLKPLLIKPDQALISLITKLMFASIFMITCLAAKSHHMRKLAMTFNYENYRDRIENALETDRILNLLWKSRHTYKFRKRIRKVDRPSSNAFWRAKSSEASPKATLLLEERNAKTTPHSGMAEPSTTFSERKQTPFSSDVNARNSPLNQSLHSHQASKASYKSVITETEKKLNFVRFSNLAAKTMGLVGSSADFRMENSRESRKQASKLFKYMRPDGRTYLTPNDLRCYIEDEVDYQFCVNLLKKNIKWQNVNPAGDDFIFGERALRKIIQNSLNELVMIVKSMQSIETALNKVDWIFSSGIVLLVMLGCSIMLWNAKEILVAAATCLSAAAFIFSTTAKNTFESLVFLLLLHPFDVGDRVFINLNTFFTPTASTIPPTMSGSDALDNLLVVEMHLLSTVFERWDGVRLYVPNYVLAMKPIYNIRRSGPLVELQRIQISFDTPIEKINELRDRLDKFVRADRTDFTDLSRVNFDAIESCNRIHLNVIAQYQGNWQDIDKQLAFRSRFLLFIKQSLQDLEITYMPPVQRIAFVDVKGRPIEGIPSANLLT